jgi:hypothetical protein
MKLTAPLKPGPGADGEMTVRRYSGELTEALRQDVRAAILQASARDHARPQRGRRGATVGGLVIALALWGAWALNGGQGPRAERASVAFSTMNGIRGARVGAEELLPAREAGAQSTKQPPAEHAPVRKAGLIPPPVPAGFRARASGLDPAGTRCTSCGRGGADEWETVFDASRDEPLVVRAAELAPKAVVNVGTRIGVALLEPVLTSGAGAPVRGRVEEDVRAGPRLAIPKGAVFVGRAFATNTDDRVQILFGWLVLAGQSHSVRALVLGPDNGLGLKGHVIQRASRGRRLGGSVLGTVGRVLSFGLLAPGGADLTGLAARDATETLGESLGSAAQRWVVSDKAIQLPAGTRAVAYLEGDLEVG